MFLCYEFKDQLAPTHFDQDFSATNPCAGISGHPFVLVVNIKFC